MATGIIPRYSPLPPPNFDPKSDTAKLAAAVDREFRRLSGLLNALADGHLDITYVAPTKPVEGDIRYADGTLWNPGSGKGLYQYRSGVWALIGGTGGTGTVTSVGNVQPAAGFTITGTNPIVAAGTWTFTLANDLAGLEGLSGTGLARRTGVDAWSLDNKAYITGNQTITLTGDVSGSGTTLIDVTLDNRYKVKIFDRRDRFLSKIGKRGKFFTKRLDFCSIRRFL